MPQCKICAGPYRRPVVLPCGHSYCQDCMVEWAEKECENRQNDGSKPGEETSECTENNAVSCPACRQCHKVPEGGAANFMRNYDLLSGDTLCEWCDEKEAVYKCVECDMWFCEGCRQNCHDVIKKKRDHSLLTVHQVAAGGVRECFRICKRHGREKIKLFCSVCNEPCCLTGGATKHKMHECVTLEDKCNDFCAEIKSKLAMFSISSKKMNEILEMWNACDKEKADNKNVVINEVIKRKNIVNEAVEKWAEEIMKLVNEDEKDYLKSSKEARKKITEQLNTVERKMKDIEQNLQHLVPANFSELEKEITNMADIDLDLDPGNMPHPSWSEFILSESKDLDSNFIDSNFGKLSYLRKLEKPQLLREINIKTNPDDIKCYPWDVAFLSGGQISIADGKYYKSGECKVKIFNLEGKLIIDSASCKEISNPHYLCQIPGYIDNVVVGNFLWGAYLWNFHTGKMIEIPLLKNTCLGGISVTKFEDQTVLVLGNYDFESEDPNRLILIHPQTGEVLEVYPCTSDLTEECLEVYPSQVAGHSAHTLIAALYVNNIEEVVVVYEQGKQVWSVGEDVVYSPKGMCMTSFKHVIIAEYVRVVLFSETGLLLATLLNHQDGIVKPVNVDYDEEKHLLAVCEEESDIMKIYRCWV